MDGLIFFFFVLIFFVFPIVKNLSKNAGKSANRYQKIAARLQKEAQMRMEQADHGVTKTRKHRQLHRNDDSDVFPEEHQANVRARQLRDRLEFRKMEKTIHSKENRAMTKVSSKGRTDWGTRGDTGIISSKGILIGLMFLILAHLILATFFPEIIPKF